MLTDLLSILTDRQWLWIAAGFYLAGFALGTMALLRERRHSRVLMYVLIASGYGLQNARLCLRGYFTAALMAALTVVSLAIPAWDATHRANVFGGNPWLELHAALALF